MATAVAPALDLPTANPDGTLTGSGTGEPGATVELWADGYRLGATTVGADGRWTVTAALPAGGYALKARAVDAEGQLLAESMAMAWEMPVFAITPTLTLPDTITAGQPVRLSGIGTPGAEIQIVADGNVVGTAIVGADGIWRYDYAPAPGVHTLSARLAADPGRASAPVTLTMPASIAPAELRPGCGIGVDRGTTYVVAPCEHISLIARRINVTPAALIAANPQIVDFNLIYPGQILNLPPR